MKFKLKKRTDATAKFIESIGAKKQPRDEVVDFVESEATVTEDVEPVRKKPKVKPVEVEEEVEETAGPPVDEKRMERPVIETSAVEVVAAPPPAQEGMSIRVENSIHLPILQNTRTNLELELGKTKVLPKFACSTCSISTECPEFKEGYVCAFNEAFAAFPVRNVDSIQELMLNIVNRNKSRLMRAYLSEELVSGGQLDMNVTRMSEVVLNQMRNLVALNQQIQAISVQVVGGPGATAGAGGVLSRLFGAKPSGDVDLNLPPATGATLDVRGEVVPDVHIAVGPEEVDEVLRRELPQQTTFDDIVDAAQTMEEANPLYVDEDTTDVPPKDEVH